VREHEERLALDLVIAVTHRHRDFFVAAGKEFGILVAAVIDQRLVQTAEAGSGIGGHKFEAEVLEAVDHEVAATLAFGQDFEGWRRRSLGGSVGQRGSDRRRARLRDGG
jgi:hypothetical protein